MLCAVSNGAMLSCMARTTRSGGGDKQGSSVPVALKIPHSATGTAETKNGLALAQEQRVLSSLPRHWNVASLLATIATLERRSSLDSDVAGSEETLKRLLQQQSELDTLEALEKAKAASVGGYIFNFD